MTYIENLQSAGLSLYEAKAYYTLIVYGEQSGRNIAELSGVPPTSVFDVLKRLQYRDLYS